MLQVMAGGWIKDIEGPLGEEGGGVLEADGGHEGDGA